MLLERVRARRRRRAKPLDVNLLAPAHDSDFQVFCEESALFWTGEQRGLHIEPRLTQEEQRDVVVGCQAHAEGEEVPVRMEDRTGDNHRVVGPG